MVNAATPYRECCPNPNCGHRFTLPELKDMAVGDGWVRHILVEDGEHAKWVTFNEYHPKTHTLAGPGRMLSVAVAARVRRALPNGDQTSFAAQLPDERSDKAETQKV